MKYRKLRKVLLNWGVEIAKTNGGSHVNLKYPGARRPYPLVLGKGMKSEVPIEYVRGLCRCFQFDFKEFWAECNPSKGAKAKAAKAFEASQAVDAVPVQASADCGQVSVGPELLDEEVSDPDSNAA